MSTVLVESILKSLTLEQKLGQLFLVYFEGSELSPALEEMITTYHIGGIILYTVAGNLQSLDQITTLIEAAQAQAQIPLWVSLDQEGGPVVRLPTATHFPSAMAMAATADPDLAYQAAQATATELKALGININYAPVVDVNSNPANPIIGIRSFGSDPEQVSAFGRATLLGYQGSGVLPTLKHFPGHGDTDVDSHVGLPCIHRSLADLQATDLAPFQDLIQSGAELIMTAHVVVPALDSTLIDGKPTPATFSTAILHDLLRQELGFDGLIITDSLTMGSLDQHYGSAQAAELALRAGADILLFGADQGHNPEDQKIAYHHLLHQVQAGMIPLQRIDDSVRRILRLKAHYGLSLNSKTSRSITASDLSIVGHSRHVKLAQTIAERAITALTWDQPLPSEGDTVLIWPQQTHELGSLIQQHCPHLRLYPIELDPCPHQIEAIAQQVTPTTQILVATLDGWRHPMQLQILRSLPALPKVAVALGSPYDISHYPKEIGTVIATYGADPAILSALVACLLGLAPCLGQLPIKLA